MSAELLEVDLEDYEEDLGVFAGRSMGGFRLLREIASGGMASVYLGYKAGPGNFGQTAAIKVVHPHLAKDREFVEMFLDEARIAATINHPNVARVLDFGRAEGTYYLAMEHLMGETWAEVVKRFVQRDVRDDLQHLPVVLAHVLERACEGLHAAHEAKDPAGTPLRIVHRDVSPQNLFVTYNGTVRVLDFGIASAAERLHVTRHGVVKGRFSYMSPEQMHAQPLDRRSDVWSLGVILWEGLARRRLFQRDTEAETIAAVTRDPLPAIPHDVGPVPPALLEIALRALNRDPTHRYDTAREMGVELARFVSHATPTPDVEVSSRITRLFREDIVRKEKLLAAAAQNAAADSQEVILPDDPREADTVPPKRRSDLKLDERLAEADAQSSRRRKPAPLPPASSAAQAALPEPAPAPGPPPLTTAKKSLAKPVVIAVLAVSVAGLGFVAFSASSRGPKPDAALATDEKPASEPKAKVAVVEPDPQPAPAPAPAGEVGTTQPTVSAAAMEPATPQAVRPTRGTLNVTAPGCWAFVYDGSQKLGTTPGSFKLSPGAHEVRLEIGGKKPGIMRTVEVPAGGTARLRVPCK